MWCSGDSGDYYGGESPASPAGGANANGKMALLKDGTVDDGARRKARRRRRGRRRPKIAMQTANLLFDVSWDVYYDSTHNWQSLTDYGLRMWEWVSSEDTHTSLSISLWEEEKVVIAFRGTDFSDKENLATDFNMHFTDR